MAVVTANLPRPEHISVVDSKELLGAEEYARTRADVNEKGMPTSLRAFVISRDPKMTVVPHFMSDVECEHLINLVDGYWMPSLVGQATNSTDAEYSKGDLENTLSKTRTSWSCMMRYAQTSVVEHLEHRLSALTGLPTTQLERMNMVRYAPGELFNEHHDGKFRPMTVFVYLNDLAEGDEQGDTFFPYLGLSFRPRRGTAVMWYNAENDTGQEDSRMLHAGRAPTKGVKYGVNCFFNVNHMRQMLQVAPDVALEEAAVVKVFELGKDDDRAQGSEEGKEKKMVAYCLSKDPKLVAVPRFVSAAEVEHLLELLKSEASGVGFCLADGTCVAPPPEVAPSSGGSASSTSNPYAEATLTLRALQFTETKVVDAVERRLCSVSGLRLECLGRLPLVRPGTRLGFCNRGCGPKSAYICLGEHGEEVFFPRLGIRLQLQCGDMIMWQNVDWETLGTAVEDVRTMRVHIRPDGVADGAFVGLDAFFHDNPLREQQLLRKFVRDDEVAVRDL